MHKATVFILAVMVNTAVSCQSVENSFTLSDFYSTNPVLDHAVNQTYETLSEHERVAQMIITSLGKLGKSSETVWPLVKNRQVGGVIFLSGDPTDFTNQINALNTESKDFPLLMSMDAEPSLINRRLPGTPEVLPTSQLKSVDQVKETAKMIDSVLTAIGFQHNYAPVIDLSPDNEAIGNRSFGYDSATVVPLASAFITQSQRDQIVSTAKHFPGHGRVSGDTHKKLVFIDGELTELGLYKPLIEQGVLSIMVGHIAVENNPEHETDGLPSTLSRVIVTNLLRQKMNFKGIIITDAMNMGAVSQIPDATLLAAKAGCDIILMPQDEVATLNAIVSESQKDSGFKKQVEASVKRIIRLKLCLGMTFK